MYVCIRSNITYVRTYRLPDITAQEKGHLLFSCDDLQPTSLQLPAHKHLLHIRTYLGLVCACMHECICVCVCVCVSVHTHPYIDVRMLSRIQSNQK